MSERVAYIMYVHPLKCESHIAGSKKRKHLTDEEKLLKEQYDKQKDDLLAEKSGFVILNESQIDGPLLNLYGFSKSQYYHSKKAAIDSAYQHGYTHYSIKDIKVKFRDSRSTERSIYSQTKKREVYNGDY